MTASIRVSLPLTAFVLLMTNNDAIAQTVTIQQPVVQHFGVNTAVSVPDRGSTLLGSVSSAQSFGGTRRPAGPSSRQAGALRQSSASVNVFIHDFEAMDKAVLAAAEAQHPVTQQSQLSGMAAHARQSLLKRHAENRRTNLPHAAEGSTFKRFGRRTLP